MAKQAKPEAPAKRRRASRASGGPTMVKVAELAGVSVFTVSAVINGSSAVSPDLRARVQEAVARSGYKRNAVARSLKTGRTMTIGVTIGNITNPFYTDLVAAVQQVLHAAGYAMILCCNDGNLDLQREHVQLLQDRMVDGLIMTPVGHDPQLRAALEAFPAPIVLVDRLLENFDSDAVLLDNRSAVSAAIRYLLSLGHRRIGYVSGPPDSFTGRERIAGFKEALAESKVKVEPELMQMGAFRTEEAYNAALRLLMAPKRPTAIFSANNQMVIGIMRAIRDLGLACPADISVATLDDFPWSSAFEPQLTTLAQPVATFAQRAAQLVLDRIKGEYAGPPRRVTLQGELKIRKSCRPLTESG
jgi:LacI family transcriptional regulator